MPRGSPGRTGIQSPPDPRRTKKARPTMRTNLKVPFAEKDQAKALGARWDATKRLWYVQNVSDLGPFARWLPQGGDVPTASAGTGAGRKTEAASVVKTGSRYFKLDCDCLPWVGCANCREKLEAHNWSTPA